MKHMESIARTIIPQVTWQGDVFLKICRADLRVLTERDHLHFVQGMIRGGMSSVDARKYWKANNQYLDDHDKNEENSFIVNIDANNLYGGIMQNYSLPLNDFKWAATRWINLNYY